MSLDPEEDKMECNFIKSGLKIPFFIDKMCRLTAQGEELNIRSLSVSLVNREATRFCSI